MVTPLSHVSVSSVDLDDRRYVFEVTNASKSVFLQAISDRECDEVCMMCVCVCACVRACIWICVYRNMCTYSIRGVCTYQWSFISEYVLSFQWITTIRNLSQLVDDTVDARAKKNRDSIVQERESIRMWISKELGSMKPKSEASRGEFNQ